MARRCPDATRSAARDPRRPRLADQRARRRHRGTVRRRRRCTACCGRSAITTSTVLDSAEGVPVRYRRDRMTVQTDDGPAEAWVYVDHRVEPGAPRPGYLERIIDGAAHHGLPQRWVDFLHRWDPVNWPRRLATHGSACAADRFRSCSPTPTSTESSTLRSTLRLPRHPRRRAGEDDRRHRRAGGRWPPTRRCTSSATPRTTRTTCRPRRTAPGSPPALDAFLDHVDVVVSLHGYGRIGPQHAAAGRRRQPRLWPRTSPRHVVGARLSRWSPTSTPIPRELRGLHPDNPVNRRAAAAHNSS